MILIVLASGRGSRLNNLTKNKPKCLVKIKNNFTIIDNLEKIFKSFTKIIIVSGYKGEQLKKKFIHNKNIVVIKNKKYNTTNMVYSMFVPSRHINDDVVITYSDIVYSKSVITRLKKFNKLILPLKSDWLKIWKMRMSKDQIFQDAENIVLNKKYIKTIGGKIVKKLPSVQYMGLLKVPFKKYKKMHQIFLRKKNFQIDMTSFLDFLIKKKNLNFIILKPNLNGLNLIHRRI